MAFLTELRTGISSLMIDIDGKRAMNEDCSASETKLTALIEVWNWVKSGDWTKHKDFASRAVCLATKSKEVAIKELGLSNLNHANTILYRANTTLEQIVGTSLITKILAGEVTEAMHLFHMKTGTTLSEVSFMKDVRDELPTPDGGTRYRLSDCLKEAKFLSFYSKEVLKKRLSVLDRRKLAYLVYLLDTYDSALANESLALNRVVSGEVNADYLTSITNPLNEAYSQTE